MNRAEMLRRVADHRGVWDLVVVGGGATGAGIALDAAARGYSVVLLERSDFGAGTSSRSTKLVHGGVRYLRQAHIGLVIESLRERGRLLRNAPHLVHPLSFVLPCYRRVDVAFYGLGLKVYDLLAGRQSLGHSSLASTERVRSLLPTIQTEGLRGGVVYCDGQFDDSRLLIHILMTAADKGATLLNYSAVTSLSRDRTGAIDGVHVLDQDTGNAFRIAARIVVNAAGPFCDDIRRMANPATKPIVAASQGSHIVLDRAFLPGEAALLIPNTPDGRVLFAIPWHGHTLVGTTDVSVSSVPVEPRSTHEEVDFILETAGRYLSKKPQRSDILSTFAGIRPLVKSGSGNTAALARDHTIRVEEPGLLTITGGKWTTYRNMAEECVDQVAVLAQLPRRPCPTRDLRLHGYLKDAEANGHLSVYGSDAIKIQDLMKADARLTAPLHSALPYTGAEVAWAVRSEMARTVADVLARRTRALFLNARAAIEMAPRVAKIMTTEMRQNEEWEAEQVKEFSQIAQGYCGE
jgi:glycerol-3-phosphate dehydrogenase